MRFLWTICRSELGYEDEEDGIIDIEVDEFTLCLRNRKTGKLVGTDFIQYEMTSELSDEIEGLIAFRNDKDFIYH